MGIKLENMALVRI